jgi:hypothetical protein
VVSLTPIGEEARADLDEVMKRKISALSRNRIPVNHPIAYLLY